MTEHALSHTLLPIGEFEKPRVREIAQELNLPVYNKPDSQEICFVPNQDYAGLVERRSPDTFREGDLVNPRGETVGTPRRPPAFHHRPAQGPWRRPHASALRDQHRRIEQSRHGRREGFAAEAHAPSRQINLLADRLKTASDLVCTAKIRYNHTPQPARVTRSGDDELRVTFDEPQSAITPGQAVVLFDNDVVLGGGWIESVD